MFLRLWFVLEQRISKSPWGSLGLKAKRQFDPP